MPGTVYLYNLHVEPAVVLLNSVALPTIPGWGDAGDGYRPAFVAVPRVNLDAPAGGKFRESSNTIKITWEGVQATASDFYIPYGPDDVGLEDDLVSLLTTNQGLVFTTAGFATKPTTLTRIWTVQ